MAPPGNRTFSRYTRHAVRLLGLQVRTHRLERGMSASELAERAGISRDLLYRVEKGDPRVSLGVAFELAAIVGVTLFEAEAAALDARTRESEEKLKLLPKAVRKTSPEPHDDF